MLVPPREYIPLLPEDALFRASDLAPDHPELLEAVLNDMVAAAQLHSPTPGLFWLGHRTSLGRVRPRPIEVLTHLYGPTSGLALASLSAVNALGLSTQVPAYENYAVPYLVEYNAVNVRLIDRAPLRARVHEHLSFTEVTILEALAEEDWWDNSRTRSLAHLSEYITRHADSIDPARLLRGSADEDSLVQEHLTRVLSGISAP